MRRLARFRQRRLRDRDRDLPRQRLGRLRERQRQHAQLQLRLHGVEVVLGANRVLPGERPPAVALDLRRPEDPLDDIGKNTDGAQARAALMSWLKEPNAPEQG